MVNKSCILLVHMNLWKQIWWLIIKYNTPFLLYLVLCTGQWQRPPHRVLQTRREVIKGWRGGGKAMQI